MDWNDRILHPLVLSGGSHEKGSGRGCAMNAISYVLGEEEISDFPKGVNSRLAYIVQEFNDICSAYAYRVREDEWIMSGCKPNEFDEETADELFPHHAAMALDLGFLTMGTDFSSGAVWEDNWAVLNVVHQDYAKEYGITTGSLVVGHRNMIHHALLRGTHKTDLAEGLIREMESRVRFIITRFRFHAGLDKPTIPTTDAINAALVAMHTPATTNA